MKIHVDFKEDYIMIVPETKFEIDYIARWQGEKLKGFVKTGTDLTDILGIKISKVMPNVDMPNK